MKRDKSHVGFLVVALCLTSVQTSGCALLGMLGNRGSEGPTGSSGGPLGSGLASALGSAGGPSFASRLTGPQPGDLAPAAAPSIVSPPRVNTDSPLPPVNIPSSGGTTPGRPQTEGTFTPREYVFEPAPRTDPSQPNLPRITTDPAGNADPVPTGEAT